jgi:hypothetical protein
MTGIGAGAAIVGVTMVARGESKPFCRIRMFATISRLWY